MGARRARPSRSSLRAAQGEVQDHGDQGRLVAAPLRGRSPVSGRARRPSALESALPGYSACSGATVSRLALTLLGIARIPCRWRRRSRVVSRTPPQPRAGPRTPRARRRASGGRELPRQRLRVTDDAVPATLHRPRRPQRRRGGAAWPGDLLRAARPTSRGARRRTSAASSSTPQHASDGVVRRGPHHRAPGGVEALAARRSRGGRRGRRRAGSPGTPSTEPCSPRSPRHGGVPRSSLGPSGTSAGGGRCRRGTVARWAGSRTAPAARNAGRAGGGIALARRPAELEDDDAVRDALAAHSRALGPAARVRRRSACVRREPPLPMGAESDTHAWSA